MMTISYKGLGSTIRGKVLWQFACLALMWVVRQERNARIVFKTRRELQRVFGILFLS